MHGYAQTNLQLFNQLRQCGYSASDMEQVVAAYGLAMELFGGHFRPNGKPFVCHLVGTASVLAGLRAPMPVVICGLLHAVYTHGQFSGGRKGPSPRKRARVREAAGERSEELLHAYTLLPWNAEAIRDFHGRMADLSANQRAVILARLANELEDHLDFGMAYCGKTSSKSLAAVRIELLALALNLGSDSFADELALAIDAQTAANIPAALCRKDRASFSVSRPSWLARLRGAFK